MCRLRFIACVGVRPACDTAAGLRGRPHAQSTRGTVFLNRCQHGLVSVRGTKHVLREERAQS